MQDLGIIDEFVEIFSAYIDSGFGLLGGDVAFLTTALITIDITLAGLFWAMGPDTDIIAKFLKKVLYVGFFALILGNFAFFADVIFQSFAGLGITATNATISSDDLMRPGFVAVTGFDAAYPLLDEISKLTGPIGFFTNIVIISVLALAWLITLLAFFFLAIQLFITIIEFKLTTLAGFILIPFALWNKTSFLAERVLGNVISSGIKLMVLAIIVGIGSTIFGSITATFQPDAVTLSQAASVILGSLSLLALGIFGPGIATGLVSGAPQLGAGAAVGTAAGVAAGTVASSAIGGAAIAKAGRAAANSVGAAASMAGGARAAYSFSSAASGSSGFKSVAAGIGGVAKTGAASARASAGQMISRIGETGINRMKTGGRAAFSATGGTSLSVSPIHPPRKETAPEWARKIRRSQTSHDAGMAVAAAVRDGDQPGAGEAPRLKDEE